MSSNSFTIGFSPCPNDSFIFDALVNNKIDTEGIVFKPCIEDIEALNRHALLKEPDITKLSFFAFADIADDYQLLDAGSALGNNCGPILISRKKYDLKDIDELSIAIPGKYTTANSLFSIAFPNAKNKKEVLFSEIEDAILKSRVDAGVIIHESRFTYKEKGLVKIIDLGEYWESEMKLPVPLGGIAIKRNIPEVMKQKINALVKKSVAFAFQNPGSSKDYVKKHAQEMDDKVINEHIRLYVNNFSLDLGNEGKNAILKYFERTRQAGLTKNTGDTIFLNNIQ
jgi:1,4-dihydroxy-6-naphthoate synthase